MNQLELTLNYCPYSYQYELHLDEHRFKVIVGGRRVGKSRVLLQELIKHCLTTDKALAWWISPTYRDAREVGWDELMEYYPTLAPAIKRIDRTNLTFEFINNSRLLFKGSDNENSLRGRGLTMAGLDEAAFMKEDVWTKCIRPALSDKRGKAIFTSTPNGRNWYHYIFGYCNKAQNKNWKRYYWPTSLNPLIDEDELTDAKNALSSVDFRQEYLAEFVTKAGMIYDDFNEENVLSYIDHGLHTHTYYMGMDFGFANPTAITLMAVENDTEWVYQLDEIYLSRTPIEQLEYKMNELCIKHGLHKSNIKYVYTDPAGNADEISSGISPVDYLREKGWIVENKGSEVAPGLALVRSYVLNAAGDRRYFVHERCKETIRSMYGYCYKLGVHDRQTEEPDKDGVHDHACDAVRYFFVNRFDHAKYIFSDLNQQSYGVDNSKVSRTMKRCGECHLKFLSYTPAGRPPFMCKGCLEIKQEKLRNAN